MRINTKTYAGLMLLLSAFSSETLTAATEYTKYTNPTPTLKSNSTDLSTAPFFYKLRHGHAVVQLGGDWTSQGEAQNINIQGLVGDHYTLNNHNQSNGLVGLGYYLKACDHSKVELLYGLNAFYLGATSVSGEIVQEQLYTNLSYHYAIQNIPLYVDAKAIIKTNSDHYHLTLDAGIGPNFMRTSHYNETPLTSYSLPDNAFSSHNNVAFSATAGVGVQFNNLLRDLPIECGYRFFYLGQGQLAMNNNQLINTIHTGSNYANALLCSISI